ncbi:hypothetical protein K3T49_06910 [Paenibacillus sonchi]|nr:hypothetical protein [Paenibacillus sonchi]
MKELLWRDTDAMLISWNRGSISAEDVGRAEISFLQEYAGIVAEAGADRLRLSDTIGILDFNKYADLVQQIKSVSEIDLQCHTHNDFGLAVANTIAGVMAGARYFHVTVNGLGERAGMPDIIHWTPAIGDNVFAHESGIHVNGMLRDKDTFEALDPWEFGKQTRYVLGKHSGKATINYYLVNEGYKPTEDESRKCLERVRQLSIDNLGEVSVEELVKIYLEVRRTSGDLLKVK